MPSATATVITIATLADTSAIARYQWKDRGVAPRGYVRGMAAAFGRVYCKLKNKRDAATEMAMADSGDGAMDAIAWYADDFNALGMDNSHAGPDVLRHLFGLLTGLGMHESAGRYCEGRDASAGNAGGETAEAGLFQVSHNSIYAHFLLSALHEQYRGSTDFQDIFRDGVNCNAASWKNWGAGDGQDFQALTKACPAFAVEYAALALRKIRSHWEAIVRKSAELRPECDDLFQAVAGYIDDNGITEI